MKYIDFRIRFADQLVFSLTDIRQIEPGFHRTRLNEWQDKEYIQKIIRGYYCFKEKKFDEPALFHIANKIYSPSYVSLESALAYYHLIPETVYAVTSVATQKTSLFKTLLGSFQFQTLKPKLFSGYQVFRSDGIPFKMATPEKAIFDFLYLKPHYKARNDFYELRINAALLKKMVKKAKLDDWVKLSQNQALNVRAQEFWRAMRDA